jgi:hypothetical protein
MAQPILIIAMNYQRAVDIANAHGLLIWRYVTTPEGVRGYRHREPAALFDPEIDVLVEPCIGNKISWWEEVKVHMDSAGLVYVKADGDC